MIEKERERDRGKKEGNELRKTGRCTDVRERERERVGDRWGE